MILYILLLFLYLTTILFSSLLLKMNISFVCSFTLFFEFRNFLFTLCVYMCHFCFQFDVLHCSLISIKLGWLIKQLKYRNMTVNDLKSKTFKIALAFHYFLRFMLNAVTRQWLFSFIFHCYICIFNFLCTFKTRDYFTWILGRQINSVKNRDTAASRLLWAANWHFSWVLSKLILQITNLLRTITVFMEQTIKVTIWTVWYGVLWAFRYSFYIRVHFNRVMLWDIRSVVRNGTRTVFG